MANEILVLDGNGNETFTLVFLYPIAIPKQYDNPLRNVVPTPSNGLPGLALDLLTASELTALDNGTAAFELVNFTKNPSLTNAEVIVIIQNYYSSKRTQYQQHYTNKYLHIGARISAA